MAEEAKRRQAILYNCLLAGNGSSPAVGRCAGTPDPVLLYHTLPLHCEDEAHIDSVRHLGVASRGLLQLGPMGRPGGELSANESLTFDTTQLGKVLFW